MLQKVRFLAPTLREGITHNVAIMGSDDLFSI